MLKKAYINIKNWLLSDKIYPYRFFIGVFAILLFVTSFLSSFYYAKSAEKNFVDINNEITQTLDSDQGKNENKQEEKSGEKNNDKYSKKTTSNGQIDDSTSENNVSSTNESENEDEDESEDTSSTNNPTPTSSSESLSAVVAFYADNQSDSDSDDENHQRVVNNILSTSASVVLHAGDIMEDGTQDSMDRFDSVTSSLRSSKSFYSALGNNDRVVGDSSTPSQIYLDFFNYPNNEQWYSVNIGNLHAVFLDSAFSSGSSSQQTWLENDLQSAASQDRITVAIYHHPTFKSSVHDKFINNNVDFVVAGHVHTYSHSEDGGIHYFTCSGQTSIGYLLAYIYESYVVLKAYDSSNNLIDTYTINNR